MKTVLHFLRWVWAILLTLLLASIVGGFLWFEVLGPIIQNPGILFRLAVGILIVGVILGAMFHQEKLGPILTISTILVALIAFAAICPPLDY
jgi:hypothetical protein